MGTSGSSPNLPLHSSPRLTRPKELFVRQITLPMESYEVEETPIVPSPSLPHSKKVYPLLYLPEGILECTTNWDTVQIPMRVKMTSIGEARKVAPKTFGQTKVVPIISDL